MWRSTQVVLIILTVPSLAAADFRWPNPHIAVPPLVHQFIVGECASYQETSYEDLDTCILEERYGYRAVVTMLMNEETGDRAAERYRACRNGVGDMGGRFHRNRATCISTSFNYKWRFEFSQEAAVQMPARPEGVAEGDLRTAASGGLADLTRLSR